MRNDIIIMSIVIIILSYLKKMLLIVMIILTKKKSELRDVARQLWVGGRINRKNDKEKYENVTFSYRPHLLVSFKSYVEWGNKFIRQRMFIRMSAIPCSRSIRTNSIIIYELPKHSYRDQSIYWCYPDSLSFFNSSIFESFISKLLRAYYLRNKKKDL